MERDAYAIWWYNRTRQAEVDLSQFDDLGVRDLKTQLADAGRKLWVLDITSDLGIPTYVAILHWMQNGQENIEFGSGAHFDPRIALLRSLTELNQFRRSALIRRQRREAQPRRRDAVAAGRASVFDLQEATDRSGPTLD